MMYEFYPLYTNLDFRLTSRMDVKCMNKVQGLENRVLTASVKITEVRKKNLKLLNKFFDTSFPKKVNEFYLGSKNYFLKISLLSPSFLRNLPFVMRKIEISK
mmetsp:Transcript_3410/g.2866  ORF Transcript_3410/g.2866 Transcript_3410/m.2866 type:complete len:102 (+) Transcript_3410:128-433(+)